MQKISRDATNNVSLNGRVFSLNNGFVCNDSIIAGYIRYNRTTYGWCEVFGSSGIFSSSGNVIRLAKFGKHTLCIAGANVAGLKMIALIPVL